MIGVEAHLESQRATQSEGSEMHPVVKLTELKLRSLHHGSVPVKVQLISKSAQIHGWRL